MTQNFLLIGRICTIDAHKLAMKLVILVKHIGYKPHIYYLPRKIEIRTASEKSVIKLVLEKLPYTIDTHCWSIYLNKEPIYEIRSTLINAIKIIVSTLI